MKNVLKKILTSSEVHPALTIIFMASSTILIALLCGYTVSYFSEESVYAAQAETSNFGKSFDSKKYTAIATLSGNMASSGEARVISLANEEVSQPVPSYTVHVFESQKNLYANASVNVRSGAGTEYDKLGTISRGTDIVVTGETDNGWYQVLYSDQAGYIKADYLQADAPGVAYIFAGDSRTVQMNKAVGTGSSIWIAKVGEGYKYFSETAVPQIDANVGNGTVVVINYGVNDLHNVDKYIKLVNSKIDAWTEAGAKVYYAAVAPVSNYPTITNADIEAFNETLRNGLDSRVGWLDGYTYLINNGFGTNDGLHYDMATYKNLYSFYISSMSV